MDDVSADGAGRHRPSGGRGRAARRGLHHRGPQAHRQRCVAWLLPALGALPAHGAIELGAVHACYAHPTSSRAHLLTFCTRPTGGYHPALFTEVAQNYVVPHRPGAIDTHVAKYLVGECARRGAGRAGVLSDCSLPSKLSSGSARRSAPQARAARTPHSLALHVPVHPRAAAYGDRAGEITRIAEQHKLGRRIVRGYPILEAEVVYSGALGEASHAGGSQTHSGESPWGRSLRDDISPSLLQRLPRPRRPPLTLSHTHTPVPQCEASTARRPRTSSPAAPASPSWTSAPASRRCRGCASTRGGSRLASRQGCSVCKGVVARLGLVVENRWPWRWSRALLMRSAVYCLPPPAGGGAHGCGEGLEPAPRGRRAAARPRLPPNL